MTMAARNSSSHLFPRTSQTVSFTNESPSALCSPRSLSFPSEGQMWLALPSGMVLRDALLTAVVSTVEGTVERRVESLNVMAGAVVASLVTAVPSAMRRMMRFGAIA